MELYVNDRWIGCYGDSYAAEAIAWSDNGNHATIYTMGATAKEADAKLIGAMRELKLISGTSVKDEPGRKESRSP